MVRLVSESDTYIAWDGKSYGGSPPPGWYLASDGRWWPPRGMIEEEPRPRSTSRPERSATSAPPPPGPRPDPPPSVDLRAGLDHTPPADWAPEPGGEFGELHPDPSSSNRRSGGGPTTNRPGRRGRFRIPNLGFLLFIGFALSRCLAGGFGDGGGEEPDFDFTEPIEQVEEATDDVLEDQAVEDEAIEEAIEDTPPVDELIDGNAVVRLDECAPLGRPGAVSVSIENNGPDDAVFLVVVEVFSTSLAIEPTELEFEITSPAESDTAAGQETEFVESWIFYQCDLVSVTRVS